MFGLNAAQELLRPVTNPLRLSRSAAESASSSKQSHRSVVLAMEQAQSASVSAPQAEAKAQAAAKASDFVRPHLLQLKAYTPIEPFEVLPSVRARHLKCAILRPLCYFGYAETPTLQM